MKAKNTSSRIWGTLFGLLGTGYCVAAALGAVDAICVTDGCALQENLTIAGLSLWWWGAGGFALVSLAALAGMADLAFAMACIGVVIETFFLGWMALSAPCVSCMGAAVLMLFALLALMPASAIGRRFVLVLFVIWMAVFSPNIFGVARDMTKPWPIHGDANARVKVIFSPTCNPCLETIDEFLRRGVPRTAFLPVAKTAKELALVQLMLDEMEAGKTFAQAFAAMRRADNPPEPARFMDGFGLRMKLYRNKLALFKAGYSKVPLVLVSGNPSWYFPMQEN